MIISMMNPLFLRLELGKYQGKKIEEKWKERKLRKKMKNRFELNKLILYVYSNSFYLFVYIIQGLRILIIFDFLLYFS